MATQITKAEFETLPDSLKTKFKPEGDNYILHEEDVEGLKKSKAEILQEKKDLQAKFDELVKFKADFDQKTAEAEEEKKKAAGEIDEWKRLYDERHKKELEIAKAETAAVFADVKRERLTNELVKHGALPDRAAYLVNELDADTELVKGDVGYQLKKKGGIGDAAEFDAMIEAAKQRTPFFFAANGASGSGASGSQTNGSGNSAKAVTRSQWDAATSEQRAAWGASITVTD